MLEEGRVGCFRFRRDSAEACSAGLEKIYLQIIGRIYARKDYIERAFDDVITLLLGVRLPMAGTGDDALPENFIQRTHPQSGATQATYMGSVGNTRNPASFRFF